MLLGLISDTHGLLRPEVFEWFASVDHILHAGDHGDAEILTELETLAPVTAVWGNVDGGELRERLPEIVKLQVGGLDVVVVHGHQLGSPTPARAAAAFPDADLVVFGHSHDPVIERVGSVLAINPGSAGPRRFNQPVTVALATVEKGSISARIVSLVESG